MALTKQAWSINALSVELGIDRRTLGKRLDGLRPLEEGPRGVKLYRLTDVIRHLKRVEDPGADEGDHRVTSQKDYRDFVIGLTIRYLFFMLSQHIPELLRKSAGLSPERTIDVASITMMAFAKLADDLCDHMEVEWQEEAPGLPPMRWQMGESRKALLAELKGMKPERVPRNDRGASHG